MMVAAMVMVDDDEQFLMMFKHGQCSRQARLTSWELQEPTAIIDIKLQHYWACPLAMEYLQECCESPNPPNTEAKKRESFAVKDSR